MSRAHSWGEAGRRVFPRAVVLFPSWLVGCVPLEREALSGRDGKEPGLLSFSVASECAQLGPADAVLAGCSESCVHERAAVNPLQVLPGAQYC